MAPQRRPAARHPGHRPAPDVRGVRRSRNVARVPTDRRLQRRAAAGRRVSPLHHPRREAGERVGVIRGTGTRKPLTTGDSERPGAPGAVRRHPRRRHRVRRRRREAPGLRVRRGGAQRRRDGLAEGADAVRSRAGGRICARSASRSGTISPASGRTCTTTPSRRTSTSRSSPCRRGGTAAWRAACCGRATYGLPAPDLQPLFLHLAYPAEGYPVPEHGYTIAPGMVRPLSRGTLRLASADPDTPALVDPNMFGEPHDLERMVDALEICREIGRADAFKDWRKTEVAPGPEAKTRDDLREFLRRTVSTYHHQCGTCRMGQDSLSVVDPDLRVHGLRNLRVADASIMPVGAVREHQRAVDHDRREGGRPHPRQTRRPGPLGVLGGPGRRSRGGRARCAPGAGPHPRDGRHRCRSSTRGAEHPADRDLGTEPLPEVRYG